MKKKVLAVTLLCAMCVTTLFGCGSKAKDEDTTDTSAKTDNTEVNEDPVYFNVGDDISTALGRDITVDSVEQYTEAPAVYGPEDGMVYVVVNMTATNNGEEDIESARSFTGDAKVNDKTVEEIPVFLPESDYAESLSAVEMKVGESFKFYRTYLVPSDWTELAVTITDKTEDYSVETKTVITVKNTDATVKN